MRFSYKKTFKYSKNILIAECQCFIAPNLLKNLRKLSELTVIYKKALDNFALQIWLNNNLHIVKFMPI